MDELMNHYESVRQLAVATGTLLDAIKANEAELKPKQKLVEKLESIKHTAIEYLLEPRDYRCWIDAPLMEPRDYRCWIDAPLMEVFTYFCRLNAEHALIIDGEVRIFRYAYSQLIMNL